MYIRKAGSPKPFKKPSENNYLEGACCCASPNVKSNTTPNVFAVPLR